VLLTLLAFEVETLELIREEDAIGFVIDALCAMPGEVDLVKHAVAVLETIGTASPDHALIVVNEGGKMAIKSKFWFIFGSVAFPLLQVACSMCLKLIVLLPTPFLSNMCSCRQSLQEGTWWLRSCPSCERCSNYDKFSVDGRGFGQTACRA